MATSKKNDEKPKSDNENLLTWLPSSTGSPSLIWTPPEEEGVRSKLIRKTKDNPFVPIGMLATTGALTYGLWCMRTGQRQMSQKMMRLRVAAQGLTIVALLVGIGFAASKGKDTKTPEESPPPSTSNNK